MGKADVPNPRKAMRAAIPAGSAVRLGDGDHVGLAEGIETALSATMLTGVPTWATINSTLMAKWEPPEHVQKVTVFGDTDPKFGGQAAAYALAHRLSCLPKRSIAVDVKLPDFGDWNDILLAERGSGALGAAETRISASQVVGHRKNGDRHSAGL